MTSIVKKSLYFVLGFCLILPMINNSAIAWTSWSQNMLTVSSQNYVAGSALTQEQIDKLNHDLQPTNVKVGVVPSHILHCRPSVRAKSRTPQNHCNENTCSELTFVSRNGQSLSQRDFDQLNHVLTTNGIRSMMYSDRNPDCLYFCGQ